MKFLDALHLQYGVIPPSQIEEAEDAEPENISHRWVSTGDTMLISRPILDDDDDDSRSAEERNRIGQLMLGTLPKRPVLSVADQPIDRAGSSSEEIGKVCAACEELDLTGTQLSEWNDVRSIVCNIENLRMLILSRTRLFTSKDPSAEDNNTDVNEHEISSKISSLVLAQNEITSLEDLHVLFPNISQLILCSNNITTCTTSFASFDSLMFLDLSANNIETWDAVWPLKDLKSLRKLNLAGNPIKSIYYDADDNDGDAPFAGLVCLNISETSISKWKMINMLAQYPGLRELFCSRTLLALPGDVRVRVQDTNRARRKGRISIGGSGAGSGAGADLGITGERGMLRASIVVRLRALDKLNGSEVKQEERNAADRWFLSLFDDYSGNGNGDTGGPQLVPTRDYDGFESPYEQLKNEENQFLYETTVQIDISSLANDLASIHNQRLLLTALASATTELADKGPARNPEEVMAEKMGKVSVEEEDEDADGKKEKTEVDENELPRTGETLSDDMGEKLKRAASEGNALVSPDQVTAKVPITLESLKEAKAAIRGSIMIAYPQGLPPWDPARVLLETEDVSDEDIKQMKDLHDPKSCVLWWANKELSREKKLCDYIGRNEKTKVLIKMQKRGQGPPVREPPIDAEAQRAMMAYWHRKQEEEKRIAQDDNDQYLSASWADPGKLKREFVGVSDMKLK